MAGTEPDPARRKMENNVQQHARAGGMKVYHHKHVPQWLRLALRISIGVVLLSLPILASREPALDLKPKLANFSSIFVVMAGLVLPLWIPFVGALTLSFTLALPLALSFAWLAYGLWAAWPNVIFLMLVTVALTATLLPAGTLVGLPVPLVAMTVTAFVAVSTTLLTVPPALAWKVMVMLTLALVLAACLSVLLAWVIFPEWSSDMVFSSASEALEHLAHLGYYVTSGSPPRLKDRGYVSAARLYGSRRRARYRAAIADMDDETEAWTVAHGSTGAVKGAVVLEVDPSGSKDIDSTTAAAVAAAAASAASIVSDQEAAGRQARLWGQEAAAGAAAAAAGGGPAHATGATLSRGQRAQRCWGRLLVVLGEGQAAEMGARAELVVGMWGRVRVMVPGCPLLPLWRRHLNPPALAAVRHAATQTALALYQLYSITSAITEPQLAALDALLSPQRRAALAALMCSALEGVAGMVPPSYHPPSAADWQAALAAQQEVLEQLQGLVAALDGALDRLGQQEQQQHQQQQQQAMMGNAAADRVHLTEDQAHAAAGAWVTAGTTACATTREAAASKDGVAGAMGQVVQQKLIVLQCWLLRRVLWQLVGCLALLQQAVTELVGSMVGAPKPVVA